MNITLNGNNKSLQKKSSVLDLLKDLQLTPETVVVELNTTIIQPDSYDSTDIGEGDQVEIIRFVGGG
ncbi:MAG TPA: sulfur carrier protein ThiS [Desulfobacterales bacterium]|nr:sulfur carrier protein ThiS [Desulfobacterales bacterium]HIP38645.1 sulfur carrier protein ThiS [Desulfocapsa sulfexigens]